jgi:hypothetical protein
MPGGYFTLYATDRFQLNPFNRNFFIDPGLGFHLDNPSPAAGGFRVRKNGLFSIYSNSVVSDEMLSDQPRWLIVNEEFGQSIGADDYCRFKKSFPEYTIRIWYCPAAHRLQ